MTLALLSGAVALSAAHWYVRTFSPSVGTPLVLLDHLFNLGMVAVVLMACWALGLRLLRVMGCVGAEPLPEALLAIALGLGAVAYGAFALGMLGLFRPPFLVAATAAMVAQAVPCTRGLLAVVEGAAREGWARFQRLKGPERLLVALAGTGFAAALPVALAPPTDYDGLVYHLATPAAFLRAGRIYPMLEIDGANFPFNAEMIYSVGLAFGSDAFGRLVNVALWGLLVLGTWWLGRRYLGHRIGFVAALVLLTVPAAYLASSSSVEMLWAFFTLAGVLAFFQYLHRGGAGWVVAMGILCGLILGTKLLAVGVPVALGICLGVHLLFARRLGLVATLRLLAIFGMVALAAGSPWYLKNWLFLGAPLYPLFADGTASYLEHVNDVGNPKTLVGFLTLPIAVFFPAGDWALSVGLPWYYFVSYLFLALPTIVLARRTRPLSYMLLFAVLFSVMWAAGYQLLRFLYPIYPLASLAVAHGLVEARLGRRSLPASWVTSLLALFLSVSLALHLVLLMGVQPLGVVVGLQSPATFLSSSKAVWIYPAVRWANERLPDGSRLYMVGSGQTYYLRHDALPDQAANNLSGLFARDGTGVGAVESLRAAGFTHVFLSEGDVRWFLLHRDPEGALRRQARLLDDLLREQAALVYRDQSVKIYRLVSSEQ